mgnify:FL=1
MARRPPSRMTRWIFISDLQLKPDEPEHEERRRLLVERVAAERPDFVIDGGDHVAGQVNDEPEEARRVAQMWAAYHRVTAPLQRVCPVIHTVGNHDQTGSPPTSDEYLRQTGRRGRRTYFPQTIGGVHMAIIDTTNGRHRAGFADHEQARWLRRDLRAARQARCTVVVGHYPVLVAPWLLDHSILRDEEPGSQGLLLPMLLEAGVDLLLCGHLHAYERTRFGTVTQIMTSASDMAIDDMAKPGEYRVAFDKRQTYVRFALEDSTVRCEAVTADGEIIDSWTQELLPKPR